MDTSDRTILRRLILGLTLVILVGVVVWVFFVRDDGKKNTSTTNEGGNTSQQTNGSQSQPGSGSPQGAGTQNQGNTQGSSTPAAGSNTGAASGQPTTLAATGPGNVAALFVGAAAAGTFGHYRYTRRRAKRA